MKIEKSGQSILTTDQWLVHAGPKSVDQWKPGRSAYECAMAWCETGSPAVPTEIRHLLDSNPDLAGCTIHSAHPEHQVRFDTLRGEPRNTDLAILADSDRGTIGISVEAKADEPFGDYIGDVLADAFDRIAHGESTEIPQRVATLLAMLPLRKPRAEKAGSIRYQLLTALAGALAFARENKCTAAVLLVHEFHTYETTEDLRRVNRNDLNRFMRRVSAGTANQLEAGKLAGPFLLQDSTELNPRMPLFIGKAIRTVKSPPYRLRQAYPL